MWFYHSENTGNYMSCNHRFSYKDYTEVGLIHNWPIVELTRLFFLRGHCKKKLKFKCVLFYGVGIRMQMFSFIGREMTAFQWDRLVFSFHIF